MKNGGPGLSGPTLPPGRPGLAFLDDLLDRAKYPLDAGVVGTFEELPAERVKLVELVLSLFVAQRRSVGWIPIGSPCYARSDVL